jgi:molybdopterin-binding protein
MNKLPGIIKHVQKSGGILLVDADMEGNNFSALIIESPDHSNWLSVGNSIFIIFKETEVSLAKDLSGRISLRNRMNCKVLNISRGDLLSTIQLQFNKYIITSAITTRAVNSLQLVVGDDVEALVKANEVSLMLK